MGRIRYDRDDAWSRFHHLGNVTRIALDAFSLSNIETPNLSDDYLVSDEFEVSHLPEILNSLHESHIEDQILEKDIGKRLLLQTMAATIYAAFEHSVIMIYAAFQTAKGETEILSPRNKGEYWKALKHLKQQGVLVEDMQGYTHVDLARQVRDAVMHRGGLVDADDAAFQDALCKSFPNQLVSFGCDDHYRQIALHDSFVWHLLSVGKNIIDSLHDHLVRLLPNEDASVLQ